VTDNSAPPLPPLTEQQVLALCQAARDTWPRNPTHGETLATQALDAALALGHPQGQGLALIARAQARQRQGQYADGLTDAQQALDIYQQLADLEGQAAARNVLGMLHYQQGQFGPAIQQFEACIDARRQLNLPLEVAAAQNNLALIYRRLGDPTRALAQFIQCLQVFRAQGHQPFQANALMNIGLIHDALGDHAEALQAFEEAYHLYDRTANIPSRNGALCNIGTALFRMGRLAEALNALQRSRAASQQPGGDPHFAANALGVMAQVRLALGQIDQAEADLQACITERQALGNPIDLASNLLALAQLQLEHRTPQQALQTLQLAEDTATNEADRPALYSLKARTLAALGHYDQAYQAEALAADLRQETLNAQSLEKMRNLQVLHQLDNARHQAETLRHQAAQLAAQLEHQSRELSLLTYNLVQRNNMIKELRQAIHDAEQAATAAATAPVAGPPPATGAALRKLGQKLDHDWTNSKQQAAFEQQFVQINESFLRRLAQQTPSLSSAELKICALIRNGLSNKEIANLTYTTVRNVESHRYRIRKKLDLGRADTLHIYLLNL